MMTSRYGPLVLGLAIGLPPITPAQCAPALIVYVSPDPIGVNDFLKMGKTGIEAAAAKIGAQARTYEASDPTTRKQNLVAAARDGADIVVMLGFEFSDLIGDVAEKYPQTKFLIIESCTKNQYPNVWCSGFRSYEGAYLAGVEMALTSQTGKIGAVLAMDIPYLHRWSDAAYEGAKAARPDIEIAATRYVGGANPFSDPVRAEQQTRFLLNDGVDRLFAVTAGGNAGVFKAAKDGGALAVGTDINQCPQAPGVILDSMELNVESVIGQSIEKLIGGQLDHNATFGLREDGVGVLALQQNVDKSGCVISTIPAVIAKVKQTKEAIAGGEILIADPMKQQ